MYKYAVLTDFVLFKCNYCVKSVIGVLKVTNDEFKLTGWYLTQQYDYQYTRQAYKRIFRRVLHFYKSQIFTVKELPKRYKTWIKHMQNMAEND
ncbi:hypothetical protein TSAR_016226 [Trichomalopsis sarcophagae]|uniref:Uncharacterized protein n=1 Tax=Trichomalopsis sarcophagae TaxID=543379 RepID=A0A232FIQ9_9HYME|nr:hypothetical protein TSAR_016226 [Trichomalopsis sarcophagae]